MVIKGTKGDDVIDGTPRDDVIKAGQGGNDTINAGGGDDRILMGKTFTAQDTIDGGSGDDTITLRGDYTGDRAVTFLASTMVNVETIALTASHSYSLTTNDANVALGQTLTVDGSALGAGDAVTFNGVGETNGHFTILAGAGNDVLTGGLQGDIFDLSAGGNDVVNGGGADDFFELDAALMPTDRINGGAGNDTVLLDGDYSAGLVLQTATLSDIETVDLAAGHSYNIKTSDGTLTGSKTLTVDASTLGAGDNFIFDASAETTGAYYIYTGAGQNTLIGGSGNDTFELARKLSAADQIDGGFGDNNLLLLNGDYSAGLTLTDSMVKNIQRIDLGEGYSYSFAFGAHTAGIVDGSGLDPDATLNIDDSAGIGPLRVLSSAGTTTLTGGVGDDFFYFENGFAGGDSVDGGGGTNRVEVAGGTAGTLAARSFRTCKASFWMAAHLMT